MGCLFQMIFRGVFPLIITSLLSILGLTMYLVKSVILPAKTVGPDQGHGHAPGLQGQSLGHGK